MTFFCRENRLEYMYIHTYIYTYARWHLYAYIYTYHILITKHGPTWTFLLNSLTPGGRVFLASNLDASLLQPLEAPGIS